MAHSKLPIFTLVVSLAALTSASMAIFAGGTAPTHIPDSRQNQVWISALRQSQFSVIPHLAGYSCETAEPPQALATPDPLIERSGSGARITVSFVVGTDGRVHSLFILEDDNPSEDGTVLKAVRSWRYRPARCNGVPVEAEAKIQFRLR